jgi:heavy metal translocating P-type ATPase
MGRAGREGVLIKGGIYLEELGRIRTIALDKTGTLTHGRLELTEIHPVGDHDPDQLLALAATAERRSEHPIARAIVRAADARGLSIAEPDSFDAAVGGGIHARVDGTELTIASPVYTTDQGHYLDPTVTDVIERLESTGNTTVVMTDRSGPLAVLALADTIRPAAAGAIDRLRSLGVEHITMLTGDNARTARAIAERAGIDRVDAGLKPEDKAARIRRLVDDHHHVAMVGDGINDAPPLAAATVGIAMGTAGSDIALETADVALMADDLTRIVTAVTIGRRTRRVVAQNLLLSLVILTALVPTALLGLIGLPAAVLAHELSELAVILNGTRMARR